MANAHIHKASLLSKRDALCLLDFIQDIHACETGKNFTNLITTFKSLAPFDYAVCLFRKQSGKSAPRFFGMNVSYPNEWAIRYMRKKYYLIDPIVKENFTNYSLQYWSETYKKNTPPKHFLTEALDFDLGKGYSIGQRTLSHAQASLFSFAGSSIEHTHRTEAILQTVAPHVHRTLYRLFGGTMEQNGTALSSREKEILLWVKDGKSTWDISIILGISQDTVKFHLKNIFQKLDASTRSQAVAVALSNRLIEL